MTNESKVEAGNITLYPIHWATVDAFAKDMSYSSRSAALRRIIDEWLQMKRGMVSEPRPTYKTE